MRNKRWVNERNGMWGEESIDRGKNGEGLNREKNGVKRKSVIV